MVLIVLIWCDTCAANREWNIAMSMGFGTQVSRMVRCDKDSILFSRLVKMFENRSDDLGVDLFKRLDLLA